MTLEAEWRAEWEVLAAERQRARRRWRAAAGGLAARARDPLGLAALVRDHPLAAAGLGAAAGALAAGLIGRRARADGVPPAAPAWPAVLRDAALGVVVPWLVRRLQGTPPPPA